MTIRKCEICGRSYTTTRREPHTCSIPCPCAWGLLHGKPTRKTYTPAKDNGLGFDGMVSRKGLS